jgi:hypothetical protein
MIVALGKMALINPMCTQLLGQFIDKIGLVRPVSRRSI